jgi:hypothetical protein
MSLADDLKNSWKSIYNYGTHESTTEAHSDSEGHTLLQRNAVAHAYLSAMITFEFTEWEARFIGNGQEDWRTSLLQRHQS